ncbi:hypothetical protein V5O48_008909 [Marasmius crinis-equi]|uniref:MYND-type domain-containing protein n=1 Tax=Marasmius crinis-equi TaxID=585013 RepID=A0ABR3FCK5_9AGAR
MPATSHGYQALLSSIQSLRRKPPPFSNLDLDSLSSDVRKPLQALVTISEVILGMSSRTMAFVARHWNQIWPWLHAFSKCSLTREPATEEGLELLDKILFISPILLSHGLFGADHREKIDPVLDQTPDALALAVELWVMAVRLEHRSIRFQCGAIALLIGLYAEAPKGPVKKQAKESFEMMLSYSDRGAIVDSALRCIILYLMPKRVEPYDLRGILGFFNDVTEQFPEEFHDISVAKDGIRWACFAISRLSSPRNPEGEEYWDDVMTCTVPCLQYLCRCIARITPAAVPVLDGDIILSMFRSTHIIVRCAELHSENVSSSLSGSYLRLLDHFGRRLLYRPVLMRVIWSIKKIRSLGLEEVSKRFPKDLLEMWTQLRDQALRRASIGKFEDESFRFPLSPQKLCGNPQCGQESLNLVHPFKRCVGCLSELYCSRECQKSAWKQHREKCKKDRERTQRGDLSGPFTNLDFAFLHKQMHHDYKDNADRIRQMKERRKRDFPDANSSDMLIRMYYTVAIPVKLTVEMRQDVFRPYKRGDSSDSVLASGVVPWRNEERDPIIAFLKAKE